MEGSRSKAPIVIPDGTSFLFRIPTQIKDLFVKQGGDDIDDFKRIGDVILTLNQDNIQDMKMQFKR